MAAAKTKETTRQVMARSEPLQSAKLTTSNEIIGPNLAPEIETNHTKMVQIPEDDYFEMAKQIRDLRDLKQRLARLEESYERNAGFAPKQNNDDTALNKRWRCT